MLRRWLCPDVALLSERSCGSSTRSCRILAVTDAPAAGPSWTREPLFATPALPLSFHIHGALFTAWVLLFAAQTSLVAARRTDLHKRLGIGGAVLAVAMVISGLVVSIASAKAARPAFGALASAPSLFVLVIPSGKRRGVHDFRRTRALPPPAGRRAQTAHVARDDRAASGRARPHAGT
jgi:hypothetical protein